MRQLLADYPDNAALGAELVACEHEGDRITRELIRRMGSGRGTRAAIDAAEGHALAGTLDDIVDHTEQAGAELELYAVEAPNEQAVALAEVLMRAGEQIGAALRALAAGGDPAPMLAQVHRLENEGDQILRDGVASLFAGGTDPMVVIRWKDIFESLEAALDACNTSAHLIERIVLSRRIRRRFAST
jgi:uncharacterized protein Yka (UPF0111/DUF47 family)